MASKPITTRVRDGIAKSLWSGPIDEVGDYQVQNLSGKTGGYRSQFPIGRASITVRKQDGGLRRGLVPEHIANPTEGKARPFDPFSLRRLADTETVQAAIDTLIKDMRSIQQQWAPAHENVDPPSSLMEEVEMAMRDPNPNPQSLADLNEMFLRDALEVGNMVAVQNLQTDGRRAEVIPLNPNTFTIDWDRHGIIEGFFQYPNAAGARFGRPEAFTTDEIMWGTLNPETARAGFYGHSPVEKLQLIINVMGGLVEKEIKELEEGMPSGLLALMGDSWDDDDYNHFETYWREEVQGQQHKVPYARGDAKFIPFNMSYKELQVLDRQKWYSKLVGAVFHVPVNETGLIIGDLNRSIDVSQRQKYKQKGLRPLLNLLEDFWNNQYIHRWWSEDINYQFDPGMDLMERKELSQIHSTQLQQGVVTINEVREEQGLDPVEWGDEPFDLRSHTRGSAADSLFGPPPGGGSDSGGQTPEAEAQGDLEAGQEPEMPEEEGDSPFEKGQGPYAGESGTWVGDVSKSLRETDNWSDFNFQPKEIQALQEDLENTFFDFIDAVLGKVKANQQLLRQEVEEQEVASPENVRKGMLEFFKLIEEEIGLDFAEETAMVLTTHKGRKVLDGEDEVLSELEAAGVDASALEIEEVRRRVVNRIQRRTLKITKPISDRLEQDLRDTLSEGWREGKGITDIERDIEDLTDKWQGTDAERLARDQLGKASKEGRLEYARETADQVGGWMKTWISTFDRRARDSHMDMDGETVPQEEPWVVNYTPEGGPSRVEEDFPGASRYGIQCRCDYSLEPAKKVEKAREWRADLSERMAKRIEEVEEEQGQEMPGILLALEANPSMSREAAADHLGVSKPTLYKWLRGSGLID